MAILTATLAELADLASPVNVVEARLGNLNAPMVVAVSDDIIPGAFWVSSMFMGEWVRGGAKIGTSEAGTIVYPVAVAP
jgi:hypothetical protein